MPSTTGRFFRRLGATLLLVASIAAFSYIDLHSIPDIRSVMFYAVPVAIAGYYLSRWHVVFLSLVASIAWVWAKLISSDDMGYGIAAWNGANVFLLFCLLGYLVNRMRTDGYSLHRMNERLKFLLDRESEAARTDSLTDLPNARYFREALKIEISRCAREERPLCLIYFDLDNFKRVNDTYKHETGDEVLVKVAEILRQSVRSADLPARIGGDEFAVLLHLADEQVARNVGKRLVTAITELGTHYPKSELSASVGVAYFETPPDDVQAVIDKADTAMYSVKQHGRHGTAVIRVRTGKIPK